MYLFSLWFYHTILHMYYYSYLLRISKRHVISTRIVVMGIIRLQTGVKLTFAGSGSFALELEG